MPLIYAFVARGTTVLADHTGPQFTGNFRSVAVQCLDRVPNGNNKFTFTANQHSVNFLIENGYTYLVVADEGWVPEITKAVVPLPCMKLYPIGSFTYSCMCAGLGDRCHLHSWKASRMSSGISLARRPGQLRLAAWTGPLGGY